MHDLILALVSDDSYIGASIYHLCTLTLSNVSRHRSDLPAFLDQLLLSFPDSSDQMLAQSLLTVLVFRDQTLNLQYIENPTKMYSCLIDSPLVVLLRVQSIYFSLIDSANLLSIILLQ